MDEAAVEPFRAGEAVRFADERGVEVDPDQFDVGAEGAGGGEPADQVAQAAADVDQAVRPGVSAVGPDRGEERAEQVDQPVADAQFLAQPLEFGVHADEQAVHGVGVEGAVPVGGQSGDDPGRGFVPAVAQLPDDLVAPNRQPTAVGQVHRGDQVGYLKMAHAQHPRACGLPVAGRYPNEWGQWGVIDQWAL